MHVNKARRNNQSLGIKLLPPRALKPTDGHNAIVDDGNITVEPGVPGAIDNLATANDQIKTLALSYAWSWPHDCESADGEEEY